MRDKDALKSRLSMLEVAERLTTLKRVGREMKGPCPICRDGDDRFYIPGNNQEVFSCRKCQASGDIIELWRLVHNLDFPGAFDSLCSAFGLALSQVEAPRIRHQPKMAAKSPAQAIKPHAWSDPAKQKAIKQEIKAGMEALTIESDGGAYLLSRGLLPDTWRAFRLGQCEARWLGIEEPRPAILIPYADQAGTVSAIKYRGFDELAKDKGKRFIQAPGSQGRLFGGHLLTGGGESKTLILLEGEMNAAAAWQASRGPGFDVLSFGSDTIPADAIEAAAELVRSHGYRKLGIWLDAEQRAIETGQRMAAALEGWLGEIFPYMSPDGLDANDILRDMGADQVLACLYEAVEENQQNVPVLPPVRSIETSEPQKPLAPQNGGAMAKAKPRASKNGDYEAGSPRQIEGLIYGPPEPRASADPLTPAELSALAPDGKEEGAIRNAIDMAYRPRRGAPLGLAILAGARALDEGLGAYDSWLSGFAGDDEG